MRASPVLSPPTDGSADSLPADLPDGARILPRISDRDTPGLTAASDRVLEVDSVLDDAVEVLASLRGAAVADARLLGFVEAADFAGRVEDLARTLEYVQIIAAQAVERTRNQAQAQHSPARTRQARASGATSATAVSATTGTEWLTGWTEAASSAVSDQDDTANPDTTGTTGGSSAAGADGATVGPGGAGSGDAGAGSVLDDGYRNPAEFLRARLRIGIGEARRRLALAADALPGEGMTGQQVPARREHLAQALAQTQVPSRSATIIATALDKIQHLTDADTLTRMEQA
ncbi:hypothetical protein ACFVSI_19685, partial [Paenarthrobacter sp. NPDC057981]